MVKVGPRETVVIRLSIQTSSYIEKTWPNLNEENGLPISRDDAFYNCLAFAVDDPTKKWWPVESDDAYDWPESFPKEETRESFIRALHDFWGYDECAGGNFEDGYVKIAIYEKDNEPKHFAKQLPNGRWASKLGGLEDIEHTTLEALEDGDYGKVVAYMRKLRNP